MAGERKQSWPDLRSVLAFVDFVSAHAQGADQAIKARGIRAALGFVDRECRALAAGAIGAGLLVCSGNRGYYVPVTQEEIGETVRRLRSQAREMQERADAIERLARRRWRIEPTFRSGPELPILAVAEDTPEARAERFVAGL